MPTNCSHLDLEAGLSVRLPRAAPPASDRIRRPRLAARQRRPEDTEEGCRASAAADLARAAAMDTSQGRWRLEHSAASWTKRADLIKQVEASHQARLAGKG
jgi:hypothetical protein